MFEQIIGQLNSLVWGPPMLVLLLGTGVFLTVRLKAITWRHIPSAFRDLWRGRHAEGDGDIPPFKALMTALSATVGTGNIAGVATAIGIGGPGALFWMWMTALVGMATKYAEAVLAVKYRETDDRGRKVGGPMYYIRNGLGAKWAWLGVAFAFFCAVAGFGIGNTVQANSVADALGTTFGISELVTGIVMAVLVALVLLGGVKRIADVANRVVPTMCVLYLLAALAVILLNLDQLIPAFKLVLVEAFTPTAAQGGFAGAGIWLAIRMGVARGIFSNEAGLGSAPIAHAAAQTNNPVRQGTIAMLGSFIDTLIICSLTGMAILVTGVWTGTEEGAAMTAVAFQNAIPWGAEIVSLALAVFAFTTLLGWSYYGERAAEFLFGTRVIVPFRVLWVLVIPIGATINLGLIWTIADTLNGMMAIPNLIALLLLSPIVVKMTREYYSSPESKGMERISG